MHFYYIYSAFSPRTLTYRNQDLENKYKICIYVKFRTIYDEINEKFLKALHIRG